ncbi:MAG: LysR family transcriptional regulator [Magnetococcales bacterium]|nr:LysR family transcriptional regulator [Magnetococcales bacterium]NGZ27218.1 LysR family transcriptional regulator [Magnetococcales bacterium]
MKTDIVKFDLNLLVAFDTLMTERGVTRAGRILGITQAAMSNTLRRLRETFDDPLFVKVGHRMEPTARAMELAEPIRTSLDHVRMALNQERFIPAQASNLFRIGMVDYAGAILLPALLNHFSVIAPHITLQVVDIGGEDEVNFLETGVVDLVLSRFQWVPPKVNLHRLFQWEYVCLYRKEHPKMQQGLTLDAFLECQHIHYYPRGMETTVVDEALSLMDRSRHVVARLDTLALIPPMLAQSNLLAVMPEGTAKYFSTAFPALTYQRLPFRTPLLRLALAWHPRTDKSPANIWLREQVKQLLAELVECDTE